MKATQRWTGIALGVIALLFVLAPAFRGALEISTREHHVLHGVMLIFAIGSGIFIAGKGELRRIAGGSGFLLLSIFAPVFAMLLMWPSEYSYFEMHPFGHVLEHFGLVVLGFVTGYAGQRYASGIGWAMGLSLLAMAFLAAWGFGVAPHGLAPAAPGGTVVNPASTATHAPNAARGAQVFAQNCAVCHGRSGEGASGPSLKGEAARKNLAQAEAWIENPLPPMPKLYPATLSAQDVTDVAAFVETLH